MYKWLVKRLKKGEEERQGMYGVREEKGLFLSCQLVLGRCLGRVSLSLSVFPIAVFSHILSLTLSVTKIQ